MLNDNIRIRIPEDLKRRFKESRPHGKMTDLLKAVILTTLEGVNLAKMAKNPPVESKVGVGVRTKYYENDLQGANSYIRFLIDTETKEKFKLYCFLKGTTMSDYLREAVEDVLREEAPAPARHLAIVSRSAVRASASRQVDISQMWRKAFSGLVA